MDLSVVISAYNRVALLKHTLESVRRASVSLGVDIVVVDDGSEPALAPELAPLGLPLRVVRQENQGSAAAKLAGIRHAVGKYTLVLDSDDLVHEDKFRLQIEALERSGADVCYTDYVTATWDDNGESLTYRPYTHELPELTDSTELFIKIRPLPHLVMYRTSYLQRCLAQPVVPPTRGMGPVGDVWLLFNVGVFPAKLVKVPGPYAIYVEHEHGNYSSDRERLTRAALEVMETFVANCPSTSETSEVRMRVGEAAFTGWRQLPRSGGKELEARFLAIWRNCPRSPVSRLGGRKFQLVSKLIGVEPAARLFRYVQAPA